MSTPKKTEFMTNNMNGEIRTLNRTSLKRVNEFVYLGSNISSTERDVDIRIGKAWAALDKLKVIWKSNLPENLKRNFFRATVESVLIYRASTWTLTKSLMKKLNGTYTRMIRAILNIPWQEHPTKQRLYGTIPTLS